MPVSMCKQGAQPRPLLQEVHGRANGHANGHASGRDGNSHDDGDADGGSDPDVGAPEAEVWAAARAGNARAVKALLHRHKLPADILHPHTGSTLLLDTAAMRTTDAEHDRRLAQVMAVLVRAGASTRRRVFPENDTAMHLLAAQPLHYRVHHRVLLLLDQIARDTSAISALMMHNAAGLLPDQVAAQSRPDLCSLLLIRRRAVVLQCDDSGRPIQRQWSLNP